MSHFLQEKRRTPGASKRLRAFACLLWLNLTMLPCSLLALDGPACPGCPEPQEAVETGSHHDHSAGSLHAGHQAPDTGHINCGADNLDCCDVDPLLPAEGNHKPGGDDHQPAPALVAHLPVSLPPAMATEAHATGPPAHRLVASRRLHVIYCVYLD